MYHPELHNYAFSIQRSGGATENTEDTEIYTEIYTEKKKKK